jgi:hypothetical protein
MLKLRKTANGYEVRVVDGTRFPLPSAAELKANAIAAATEFGGDDSEAVRILADCEFNFEIVPGKDIVEELIGVVITTSPESAAILRDPDHPAVPDVMGSLIEACPDIGSSRVVAHGESPSPIPKRKRIPAPKRADTSRQMDLFVRQLTAGFLAQGRDATAFGEAARWGHFPLINEMLAAGADVDVRTETGVTALMLAASSGHIDVLRTLIDAGADMNATDASRGMTPLMWNLAALHSEKTYLSIVRELLTAGADRTITANDGKTALDWARERGSQRLLALLAEA